MNIKFIELHLGDHTIVHGYDANNKEITERVKVQDYAPKTIAIHRIKSLSTKYVLTDYVDGRWVYWEYKETYESVKNQLIT